MIGVSVDSPSSRVHISSPRRLFVGSPVTHQVLCEVSPPNLDRLSRDASSLSEDLDELRAKIKRLDVPKLPLESRSPAHFTVSTVSTDLSPVVAISDKVECVKHDLATETRHRIARDDENGQRLQVLQQTLDAKSSQQHDMELHLQRLHQWMQKLELRIEDGAKDLIFRKETEEALRRAIAELSEEVKAERRERTSHDEDLLRQISKGEARLDDEKKLREEADQAMRQEFAVDREAARRLEQRCKEASEAWALKSTSLESGIFAEKAARDAEVRRLDQAVAEISASVRAGLEKMERKVADLQEKLHKEFEGKLMAQRRTADSELDKKISDLKDTVDANAESARTAREAIRAEMARERQSREAQADLLASNFKDSLQAKLDPLMGRMSDVQRRAEDITSRVGKDLEVARAALESLIKDEQEAREAAVQLAKAACKEEAQTLASSIAGLKSSLKDIGEQLQSDSAMKAQELRKEVARCDEKIRELRQERCTIEQRTSAPRQRNTMKTIVPENTRSN
ncbi:unnamed protein product [Effrenium voratum]|nr:unnamed protein product [Effrenium voratum]